MTNANAEEDPNDYDRVPVQCRCPQCCEDDMDYLGWVDDDHVRCATCGTIYDPNWRRNAE